MLGLAATGASLFDADLARKSRHDAIEWREQDLAFREEERRWRLEQTAWHAEEVQQRTLDNRRREIDEKNVQLESISSVAALIGGFEVVALVDLQFPDDVPEWLVSLYAASAAVTVCLMTFAYLSTTLMLVGTLKKFETNELNQARVRSGMSGNGGGSFGGGPGGAVRSGTSSAAFERTRFIVFWENHCREDWDRAYRAFSLGVPR